jgi:hypothetical protein
MMNNLRDYIIYLAWCVTELMHGRNPRNGKTDDERIQEYEEDECTNCPGNIPENKGCFSCWVWRDEHQEGNW